MMMASSGNNLHVVGSEICIASTRLAAAIVLTVAVFISITGLNTLVPKQVYRLNLPYVFQRDYKF